LVQDAAKQLTDLPVFPHSEWNPKPKQVLRKEKGHEHEVTHSVYCGRMRVVTKSCSHENSTVELVALQLRSIQTYYFEKKILSEYACH
jgi:hypothetical protein